MLRRFLIGAVAVAAFTLTQGCSVECEVCGKIGNEKFCDTVEDVKRSDCKDCTDDVIKDMTVSDEIKNQFMLEGNQLSDEELQGAKKLGVKFSCEKK